jgi:hypothetical protein
MDASIASTSTLHSIPAFGQFDVDRRVSSDGFDSVMDDVDKHRSFSARRTVGAREHLTLKSALLNRKEAEQRFPPSIISFDQVPVVVRPLSGTAVRTGNVATQHHHHATILVLESFFDGIDDHVDVRQEVWDYDRSLIHSVHAG